MGDLPAPVPEVLQQATGERPVLVTGFGPFHHHVVNASWVAVQEMKKLGVKHNSKEVRLEIREIPVAYEVVSSMIPKLYEEVKPKLCLHVGVSPYKVVKLEKHGKNSRYGMADIYGKAPSNLTCVSGGPDLIKTFFNVEKVCQSVAQKQTDVAFDVSSDAGRYLCDFLYYTSLHQKQAPAFFVHVPELNKPYSAQQLAIAIKNIVEALLDELAGTCTEV